MPQPDADTTDPSTPAPGGGAGVAASRDGTHFAASTNASDVVGNTTAVAAAGSAAATAPTAASALATAIALASATSTAATSTIAPTGGAPVLLAADTSRFVGQNASVHRLPSHEAGPAAASRGFVSVNAPKSSPSDAPATPVRDGRSNRDGIDAGSNDDSDECDTPHAPWRLSRRPALAAVVPLIAGIALHKAIPLPPGALVAITAAVVLAAYFLHRRSAVASTAGLGLAVLLVGVLLARIEAYQYAADEIGLFAGDERRLAQLELQIDNEPRIVTPPAAAGHPIPAKQTTLASAVRVLTGDGWQPASGSILVQIAEPNPQLAQGQRVRVIGMFERPAPAMNPGQFDWAAYYRDQGVITSLQIAHASNITIIDRHPLTWLQTLRHRTRTLLGEGFTDRQSLDHALLRALVLGDTDPELRDVQDQFRATGTSHHLAISGMHVGVVGGSMFLLTLALRLRPRWRWTLTMATVLLYGLVTLPSTPVVRAVLLWLIVGGGMLLRRRTDLLQMLSLVLLALLLYHPLDLYNAGFQLSFGTVLGLVLLTGPLLRQLRGRPDPALRAVEPSGAAARAAGRAGRWMDDKILTTLAAAVAAWLVSMPLVAYHFTQLNPYAIFASIALAPLVLVALVGGVLKIVLTLLFPSVATSLAWGAQQPSLWMRHAVDWLAGLPNGDIPLPAPAVWVLAIYFTALLLATRPWRLASVRWGWRGATAGALAMLLVLPYAGGAGPAPGDGSLRLTLLNVGAGQCCVVQPPGGRVFIIDAGTLSMADPMRKCIVPFLRERGITSIDTVAVSHANTDHYSAVADLVSTYGVREVLVADAFIPSVRGNYAGEQLLAELDRDQRPPRVVVTGDVVPIASRTTLAVLWPPADATDAQGLPLDANDTSLVLMLTHAGHRVLFTGDIEDAAMGALLQHPERLRADVLVAPHHGSSEKRTAEFIRAVAPRIILSSNDRTLSGKQTRFDTLVGDIPLLRTHQAGGITVTLPGPADAQPIASAAVSTDATNAPAAPGRGTPVSTSSTAAPPWPHIRVEPFLGEGIDLAED